MIAERTPIDDCFLHDKDRLRHAEAISLLKQNLRPIAGSEPVALADASNRILAEDTAAPHNVPLHNNAAVDGYAFRHSDLSTELMPVGGRIAAGDLDPEPLPSKIAVRIFTGAVMPEGADSVAMQEDCKTEGKTVTLPAGLKVGANCRLAGEDLRSGDLVGTKGIRLSAADIAAMASIGQATLPVFKKLKVTIISSGDELRTVGDDQAPLRVGEVWDVNAPLLSTLLSKLPVDMARTNIVADHQKAVEAVLRDASQTSDIILTTGGASRGAEDHMLAVLDKIGKRHLWQLAVKPGRPMMFGQIPRNEQSADCFYFGLPGNPVAAMVCFLLYVRPSILRLGGAAWSEPPHFPLPAAFEIPKKKPDRREFLRGILETGDDGTVAVNKFARDGSGLISSLRMADGLIEIPEEVTSVKKSQIVDFIPFSSFD